MCTIRSALLLCCCLWGMACAPPPAGVSADCAQPPAATTLSPACAPPERPTAPPAPPVACHGQPVWVSELHVDPPGPDGDGHLEFVELQTTPDAVLDGWSLVFVDGASDRVYMQVALLGQADAAGRFVVGGAGVPGAQAFPPGTMQNGPDAVQVVDCHNRVFDEVGYGNAPPNSLIQRWVPRAPQGQSVHACHPTTPGPATVFFHGAPSADATPPLHAACGDDVVTAPPEGSASEDPPLSPTPPTCDPTPGVRFSEVFYDPVGVDAGQEFLEFVGPVGAPLAGWWVEAIDGRTGTPYRTLGLADLVVDADGVALLHDRAGVRLGLQNGPDALVLRTCDGQAHDAIVYGVFGPTDVPLPDTWGPSVGALVAGDSWSRCADDPDGFVAGAPSPGLRQSVDESGGCLGPDGQPVPPPGTDTDATPPPDAGAPLPGDAEPPDATPTDADATPGPADAQPPGDATPADVAPPRDTQDTASTPRDTGVVPVPDATTPDCLCSGTCPRDPRTTVWIDELFVDPEGADDPAVEFVELVGPPHTSLDGLALVAINGANDETYLRVSLAGYQLDASGRLVIGGQANGLRGPALPGTLQNGPDALALQVCEGRFQSGVSYGRHTRPPNFPEVVVSAPPAGSSLQRCPANDAAPVYVRAAPTPGAPSADLGTACDAAPRQGGRKVMPP